MKLKFTQPVFSLISLFIFITACSPKYWDLTGTVSGPAIAEPGDALGQKIAVTVINTGATTAENFTVDLVLSSDKIIPVALATPSQTFSEDMLLEGGRETVPEIFPGQALTITLNGTNLIPADTPPGDYYIGIVVDAEQVIRENIEANNVSITPLQICTSVAGVNSISLLEASGGAVGYARMRFSWLYSSGERPLAMTITVFHEDNGEWSNIMPDKEPFTVPDPANTTQTEVTIFRLFSGRYRVLFTASYSCTRQREYSYEFDI